MPCQLDGLPFLFRTFHACKGLRLEIELLGRFGAYSIRSEPTKARRRGEQSSPFCKASIAYEGGQASGKASTLFQLDLLRLDLLFQAEREVGNSLGEGKKSLDVAGRRFPRP